MTPLYQELHRWAGIPFIWGETDCFLCCCDWIKRVRGVDPAQDLRGTYDSRGSAQKETNYLRDPIGSIEKYLATIGGLERSDDLRKGDLGLIHIRESDGRISPFAAIWLGTAWACKGPDGTTTIDGKAVGVLAAWSVGYEA